MNQVAQVRKGPQLRNPRQIFEEEQEALRARTSGEAHLQALSSIVDHQKKHALLLAALQEAMTEIAQEIDSLKKEVDALRKAKA